MRDAHIFDYLLRFLLRTSGETGLIGDMQSIISTDQLRTLLNDTFRIMGEQPWIGAATDSETMVNIPRGKMETLYRLEHDEWVFVPVVRTQKKGAKVVEHGFEVHRDEAGWKIVTAALEIDGSATAKVHSEAARNHAVQQELEKLRMLAKNARATA